MQTELYRHFDADGRLLYVGVSWSAVVRYGSGHKAVADWARQSVSMTIERFATREQALAAEREAIRTEGPLHNGQRAPKPRPIYAPPIIDPRISLEPERRQIGCAAEYVAKIELDRAGVSRERVFGADDLSRSRMIRAAREGDTVHLLDVQITDVELVALLREGVAVVSVVSDLYLSSRRTRVGWQELSERYTDDEWRAAVAEWDAVRA